MAGKSDETLQARCDIYDSVVAKPAGNAADKRTAIASLHSPEPRNATQALTVQATTGSGQILLHQWIHNDNRNSMTLG